MRKSIVWFGALPLIAMSTQGCLLIGLRHAMHGSSVHVSSFTTASGPTVRENRSVGAFHRLTVGSAFEVDVTVGPATSVTIEAPKAALSHIVTNVDGGTLEVGISGSLNIDGPLRVHVTTPSLDAIDLSGSCRGQLTGVKAQDFEVQLSGAAKLSVSGSATSLKADVSGSSELDWPNLNLTTLRFNQSGAGQATISGHAATANIEASGSSHLDADAFTADTVNVLAEGASRVSITATKKLEAKASGASSIQYSGAASEVSSSTSGAASIQRR